MFEFDNVTDLSLARAIAGMYNRKNSIMKTNKDLFC